MEPRQDARHGRVHADSGVVPHLAYERHHGAVVLVLVLIAVIAFLIWRRRKGSEADEEPQLLDGPVIDVKAEEKH